MSIHEAVLPTAPTASAVPTAPVEAVSVDDALGTFVLAFAADPVVRWLFPAGHQYLTAFPELLRLMVGPASADGTVDRADGGAGAAAWLKPGGKQPAEELVMFAQRAIAPARLDDAMAFLEGLDHHHPDWPVWYLPFLGVDPTAQGRGVGGALLSRGTDRADRDGLDAYLEATTPRNRALYERHGFRVVGQVQVADSPPIWPMLRTPR